MCSKAYILKIVYFCPPRWSSGSTTFLWITIEDAEDVKKTKKIRRTQLVVAKKIIKIECGLWVEWVLRDKGPTQIIIIMSCGIEWWLRRTWWRGLTLEHWTSHLVHVLIGNKRWWWCMEFWVSKTGRTKVPAKVTYKTCEIEWISCIEGGKKGVGSEKVSLVDI